MSFCRAPSCYERTFLTLSKNRATKEANSPDEYPFFGGLHYRICKWNLSVFVSEI